MMDVPIEPAPAHQVLHMTTMSKLAFGFAFNGTKLVADPAEEESLHDAMLRTIGQHAGATVAECGRCKRVGDQYTYPITLDNGVRGKVVIEGNAT
ncbi:hypothetical protein [Pseudomonas sp. MWU12-2323]|uniref:hypothetical protein n=1 Tax=Pseudomonas sp. MWU12-2323 TaxID=2651296 RepID=UPI00128B9444|nr:hypothetical protein [Pseudomonas sp. MWU12-2323]MPQ69482.1 hypothetical protein [Pseudomonas sp. MWU12-2323]